MKVITDTVLELLYPKKCVRCQEILEDSKRGICPGCEKKLPRIGTDFCLKCGKFLEEEQEEYCDDCREKEHTFDQNRGLYRYDAAMKGMIYRFKYQNQRYYADFFAEEAVRILGSQIRQWQVDGVVPVPLHKKREKIRGFNQAQEVAERMCRQMHLPLCRQLAVREKNTLPQKLLNRKAREKNLKNAFKIADNSVKLKRVLLLDDIYTTGSTLDALAEVFREAGAERVYALCLCIGEGR